MIISKKKERENESVIQASLMEREWKIPKFKLYSSYKLILQLNIFLVLIK